MKTQEFKCSKHGKFEVDLEPGQDAPIWCPIYVSGKTPCGERLKRVYSVPSVHYKGGGFYSTDNTVLDDRTK